MNKSTKAHLLTIAQILIVILIIGIAATLLICCPLILGGILGTCVVAGIYTSMYKENKDSL